MSRNSVSPDTYLQPGFPGLEADDRREQDTTPLRVVVVGPVYGGSEPIAGYVRTAFHRLEHSVVYVDNTGFRPHLKQIEAEPNPERRTVLLNRLIAEATTKAVIASRHHRAQLVFALAQAPISLDGVRALREAGAVTAFWFVENYRAFPYWRSVSAEYDFFFTIQKGEFFTELEQAKARNFAYIPVGCDPMVHKPIAMDEELRLEFGAEVSLAGAPYPNRIRLLKEIDVGVVHVWGEGWPTEGLPRIHVKKRGSRFNAEEMVRIYSGTNISLNLHSCLEGAMFDSSPDFLNPRLFECAAVGGFQLVDYRNDLHRVYTPQEEIVTFRSPDELVDNIRYYLSHEDERRRIASRARERAVRDHTYECRISEIVNYIRAHAGRELNAGGIRANFTAPLLRLGVKTHREGNVSSAEQLYLHVLEENSKDGDAKHLLGLAYVRQTDPQRALPYLRDAVESNPQSALFIYDYAATLQKCDRIQEAAIWYKKLLSIAPGYAPAYAGLGELFVTTGSLKPAREALRTALRLCPQSHKQRITLGNVLRELGDLSEAEAQYRNYLDAYPDDSTGHNNLALCLVEQGRLEEATRAYTKALLLNPGNSSIISNFLFSQCYEPSHTADFLFGLHRQYASEIEAGVPTARPKETPRDHSCLRIGIVSPDFRSHSVAYFLEPLFSSVDITKLTLYAYSNTLNPDDTTTRLRSYCHHWREISNMSDEQAAELIEKDAIDILVDVAGHTSGNRLPLFARHPATVQVTWLGYPFTTGLSRVEYRITDALADPPEADYACTESLLRLSTSFLCYSPPPSSPSPVYVRSGRRTGLVLGSFNAVPKLNDNVINLWSQVLSSIPDSKLLLKHKSFNDSAVEHRFRASFAANGLAAHRLEIRGYVEGISDHLEIYREVDVALDPFPYNGTTTTCEALWMGVPVVTLAGDRHSGRVGVSILTNVGLDELIAKTPQEYIAILQKMNSDRDYLCSLHSRARPALAESPVCDRNTFARQFETAMLEVFSRAKSVYSTGENYD